MRAVRQQPFLLAMGDEIDERGDVEDERDLAAAEDGRAADAAQVGEQAAERLDDGLELAHQLIDDDAGTLTAELNDDDALARRHRAFHLEQLAQADEWQRFAAQVEEVAVSGEILVFDAFDDGIQWDDVGDLADTDLEAVDDGQGERQTDGESRAFAFD